MPRSKVTGQAVRSIIKSNARREHFLSKPAAPKKEQKPREKKTKDSKAVLKIKSLDVSEAVKTKKLKQLNHQVQNRSRRNAGTQYKGTQSLRLYTNASILGYRRSLVNQYPNQSLLRIEGVTCKQDTDFYLGKRVAYIYKAQKARKVSGLQGKDAGRGVKFTKTRVVWGRITKPHGNGGVVRARFTRNLTPKSMGDRVRVMLYPSRV